MVTLGKAITTTTWSDLELQSIEGAFCQGDTKVQYMCEAPVSSNGWAAVGGGCYQKVSAIPCQ